MKEYKVDYSKVEEFTLYDYIHLSNKEFIPGEILLQEQIPDKYYFIFLGLFGYQIDIEVKRILDVDDFMKSDCEVYFSNYDCGYITLLIKDAEALELIYSNFSQIGAFNI